MVALVKLGGSNLKMIELERKDRLRVKLISRYYSFLLIIVS